MPLERSKRRAVVIVAIVLLVITSLTAACGLLQAPGNGTMGTGTTGVLATIVDPDDGNKPIVELIGQAISSVDVETYLLSDRAVVDSLVGARQRGATVRVILEEHPYGAGEGNGAVFRHLQSAGIQARWSNPTFRFTHEKAIVIDDRTAIVMTLNLTRSAFVDNREFAIVDTDATDVAEVHSVFEADWERRPVNPSAPNLVVSPTNSRAKLLNLIGGAQKSIDVYAEEMQDHRIEDALVAAERRGARVRVILPAPSAGQQDANESGRANIAQGGVDVHLLAKPYIHAKIVVVDGKKVFVGSENFSDTSLDRNREMGVLVAAGPALDRIETIFEKDWAR